MKLAEGRILADRYEIIEPIGAGGMAIVYKALDLKLERIITVKVLREEYITDDDFLKRFNIEARSAASLSNSNIVNVYDVGKEGDINFIIMEYIDGVTLKELIVRRAPFDNEEALGVAIQIASALSHAHKNGIIHRDIKPQNIMVTKTGIVKVTDFGIARNAESQTTTTSSNAMGSVHYFSPEQARGKYVDFRSDIYALGIIMYEMSTGTLPFDGDSAVAVALKHINEDLPDMREINPDVSISVLRISEKAADKASSKRYASADEMLVDLKKAMTNESGDFIKPAATGVGSFTRVLEKDEFESINDAKYDYDDDDDDYYGDYDEDDDDDDFYDEEEYLDKRTERKIIIAAICTAIAIIALISSIGFWLLNGGDEAKPTTSSPMVPLHGLTLEQAKDILDDRDITIGQVDEAYDDAVREGLIIEQTPAHGEPIASGSTIAVTISKGTDKIEVPTTTNKIIADVYTMREFANNIFALEEEYVYSDDYPNHVVISQEPEAGSMAARGTTIQLKVSQGKEMKKVLVPNLLGDTEEVAKRKLEENNLRIGQVTTGSSDDYPVGQVFKQSYDGGKEVNEGTSITFIVSAGKREETQPTEAPATDAPTTDAPTTDASATEAPTTEAPPSESPDPNSYGPIPTATINIPAPVGELNSGAVRVYVEKIANGVAERIYDRAGLQSTDFPLSVPVSGRGPFEVQVYVNDQLKSRENYDLGPDPY